MLVACQSMQQVNYGYQQPAAYQYQQPFTAFRQVQPQPQPLPQPEPQPLTYQQPAATYQYQQPVYQQVS